MRRFVGTVKRTLTNLSMTIEEIFADADKVGVRATLRGISSAAGREVTVREIQIYRIADGHIAERWFVVDRTNLQ
jgi:predicted ester cyclase